eukprot:Plantae.Rhodophyta-Purpureofilum_apyrenoidigerum.ctg5574.p1 GENE.Plantae.Rhodophyta-Purpureofilum_apyrenoidigerum.ctg5574~~Plantae.Rhodophyta-Purpureofilum_apyrenoidigerum.ctg5574.p1  ORF type:complete len:322 (-),score=73.00 Plantae.Rhodophyta-Purpureofilum_apyrenoidigerum.ctg5574:1023-1988(-)
MADRKATNKYYPPEYFNEYLEKGGKGSINSYRGQHPLRERAKKLKDGILRIRFEMPFNIWCTGCNNHIGKGVRYNADKKKVDMYYSTPIYNFRMKCHLCDNYIEVQTDPQGRDYVVVQGGRRKVEEWSAADAETVDLTNVGTAEGTGGGTDPFASLEKEIMQRKEAEEGKQRLKSLMVDRDERFKDDYASSQLLRKRFRDEKKRAAERKTADDTFRQRHNLALPLATPSMQDVHDARLAIESRVKRVKRGRTVNREMLPQKPPCTSKQALAKQAERKLREAGVEVKRLQGASSEPSTSLVATNSAGLVKSRQSRFRAQLRR